MVLRPVAIILLIILIYISLHPKVRPCYKWMILHASLFELIFILMNVFTSILQEDLVKTATYRFAMAFFGNLSVNALLAFNCIRFYFVRFWKDTNTPIPPIGMISFAITYDILISPLCYVMMTYLHHESAENIVLIILLVIYIILPVLLLNEIWKMAKMLTGNKSCFPETTAHMDLIRASLIVVLQVVFSLSFIAYSYYQENVYFHLKNDAESMERLKQYFILSNFQSIIFEVFVIFNATIVLSMLKAYRTILNGTAKDIKRFMMGTRTSVITSSPGLTPVLEQNLKN
uniref:Uncharacterized protein n=1 Tax=Acrobeloides nanus TaxID=290746 RepID=A0A914DYN2_9BILA